MAKWEELNRKRKPFVRMGENLFGGMLTNIRRSFLSEIREVDNIQGIDRVLDDFDFEADWWSNYEKFYLKTTPYFAQEFLSRYKSAWKLLERKEKDVWVEKVVQYVRETSGAKITSIKNKHMADIINAVGSAVNTGMDEGLGMLDIAKIINRKLIHIDKWKALQIARTETGAAASYGVELGAEDLPGNKMKVWISSFTITSRGSNPNDKVNHMAMDGQQVKPGQPFIEPMTGDAIMYPNDPEALPEQTVNCNCGHEVIITDEIF